MHRSAHVRVAQTLLDSGVLPYTADSRELAAFMDGMFVHPFRMSDHEDIIGQHLTPPPEDPLTHAFLLGCVANVYTQEHWKEAFIEETVTALRSVNRYTQDSVMRYIFRHIDHVDTPLPEEDRTLPVYRSYARAESIPLPRFPFTQLWNADERRQAITDPFSEGTDNGISQVFRMRTIDTFVATISAELAEILPPYLPTT